MIIWRKRRPSSSPELIAVLRDLVREVHLLREDEFPDFPHFSESAFDDSNVTLTVGSLDVGRTEGMV